MTLEQQAIRLMQEHINDLTERNKNLSKIVEKARMLFYDDWTWDGDNYSINQLKEALQKNEST